MAAYYNHPQQLAWAVAQGCSVNVMNQGLTLIEMIAKRHMRKREQSRRRHFQQITDHQALHEGHTHDEFGRVRISYMRTIDMLIDSEVSIEGRIVTHDHITVFRHPWTFFRFSAVQNDRGAVLRAIRRMIRPHHEFKQWFDTPYGRTFFHELMPLSPSCYPGALGCNYEEARAFVMRPFLLDALQAVLVGRVMEDNRTTVLRMLNDDVLSIIVDWLMRGFYQSA